ncbi:unnamed protein product [Brassica rapa subsp. trilocularis]
MYAYSNLLTYRDRAGSGSIAVKHSAQATTTFLLECSWLWCPGAASSQGASSRIQPRILCHLSHRSHRWLHKFWWLHQFRWLEICVKSLRRPLAKTTLASKNPHNERPMCLVTSHTEYCILTSGKRIKPIPSLS